MFVIRTTYQVPFDVLEPGLAEHRAFLSEGYEKNWLLASGPQNPLVGGVIISLLKDRKTLDAFLARDPFVIKGYTTYDMIEFEPVKYHPAIEPLIK